MEPETIKTEIANLNMQLTNINKQRDDMINTIREKYREIVKNAGDALEYVSDYILLTHWFYCLNIEDSYLEFSGMRYMDHNEAFVFDNILRELLEPYITITDSISEDRGYFVYYKINV